MAVKRRAMSRLTEEEANKFLKSICPESTKSSGTKSSGRKPWAKRGIGC
jgi:hypothetical protein